MITKAKTHESTKNQGKHKHRLVTDVGQPRIPLTKKPQTKSPEKLEDWIDAS